MLRRGRQPVFASSPIARAISSRQMVPLLGSTAPQTHASR